MSDDSRFSPVVALDMDGVLRVAKPDPGESPAEAVYRKRVTVHRDGYPTHFHREPDWDEKGRWIKDHWFCGIGADWVRSLLVRGIPVVWATTWGDAANRYLARPLGLPELPVATVNPGPEFWLPSLWKAVEMRDVLPGRPLLWVDDYVSSEALEVLDWSRRGSGSGLTHWHYVKGEAGITQEDVAQMEIWLALASSPASQEELRRRRDERNQRRQQTALDQFGATRDESWFSIHRRLLLAIGPNHLITELLADLAVMHPNAVNPVEVDELVARRGPAHTPPTTELLSLMRVEPLDPRGGIGA